MLEPLELLEIEVGWIFMAFKYYFPPSYCFVRPLSKDKALSSYHVHHTQGIAATIPKQIALET